MSAIETGSMSSTATENVSATATNHMSAMDRLVAEAVTLANTSGFLVSKQGNANLTHTSFALTPARVRRSEFALAVKLANLLNTLTMDVAANHDYLRKTLAQTAAGDPDFTGRLLSILGDDPRPKAATIEFSINRYDFFPGASTRADAPPSERGLRMVEMNCIAAGGIAQGGLMSDVHRQLLAHPAAAAAGISADPSALPPNEVLADGANAFAAAHKHFCTMYQKASWPPVRLVMIVIAPYVNACDQDMLRWRLWREHGLDCVRLTLKEILEHGSLLEDGALCISGCKGIPAFVVSVAYFRCAYSPAQYPTETEWRARALLERSCAVSCPSVAMQLVGTKRVQQALGEPGVLERLCRNAEDAALIRSCFVRQYALHADRAGGAAAKLARERPDDFVLKPQREGGGNNLYREELRQAIEEMDAEERGGFVLMERIYPAVAGGVMVRGGKWTTADIVAELGIFGSVIRVKNKELENKIIGHSMKSKLSTVDDGGIDAGVAVYDSPQLF